MVAPDPAAPAPSAPAGGPACPVVGIGASAGGLEALRELLALLPTDSGLAFVVVQHLAPERPTMLASILANGSALPVIDIVDGMRAEPDRVHFMPSDADLWIERGTFRLRPRALTGRLHLPIDTFFRSLALDLDERAFAVVLSGSGSDGTEGLRAIRAEGGFALVQDPATAGFPGMPENAIAAGMVDFCGAPAAIAAELGRLSRLAYLKAPRRASGEPDLGNEGESESGGTSESEVEPQRSLDVVLALVRQQTGVDFSGYKRSTVARRVERRMVLRRSPTLAQYVTTLRSDRAEAKTLANDMLIHVTSFFRDASAFEAVKAKVFRPLVKQKADQGTIRIWVAGCSTGEEAYALVICLLETLDEQDKYLSLKLFGTDLSDEAVEVARRGRYSEAALADVSPERIHRFFEKDEQGYRIDKRVRELCVFVRHDVTRDPPFARLDLISCRNLLIYFDAELQRRVVTMLHYCLNPRGYLFLGQSEALTSFRDLFTSIDKVNRIFARIGDSPRHAFPMPIDREAEARVAVPTTLDRRPHALEVQRQADHLLITRYAPPGVVVNNRLDVIQFRGRTGAFLEPPPGQPQANVLRMARDGLAPHLHQTIESARTRATSVRREGLRLRTGSETRTFNLEVVPLTVLAGCEPYFLILFEDAVAPGLAATTPALPPVLAASAGAEDDSVELRRLKAELVATKDYLLELTSEHQVTTDELAAANEELIATNEELQSANEELQSAKEELQSTNEELSTVNDELRSRNVELDQIANDLVNVLSSVEIPVIIVDLEQRVRRFTPTVRAIASLIPEDVGRPIDDLKLKLDMDDLGAHIQEVIETLQARDWEVRAHDGRWFRMQIRPYRTPDNRLDGAVIAFVDVDVLRQTRSAAEAAGDYARSIVETVTSALVVLDSDLRIVSNNGAFRRSFGLINHSGDRLLLADVPEGPWRDAKVRQSLLDCLHRGIPLSALEVTTELSERGRRVLSLAGRPIAMNGANHLILLVIDDVTELRAFESERALLLESEKRSRLEAERASRAKDVFLATLSHELRTPLSTMLMSAQLLRKIGSSDARIERVISSIERAVNAQSALIDDLLDVSRIVSGKLMLVMGPVDFKAVIENVLETTRPAAEAKSLRVEADLGSGDCLIDGDGARLQQIAINLLNNAIKFTPAGGRVWVRLEKAEHEARFTVQDSGMGIAPEVLPRLFARFVQADSSVTRTHGGLGLGLSIVRHLAEIHGGTVEAESAGVGKGATFRVRLPLSTGNASDVHPSRSSPIPLTGVRVLLVEDDEDTRFACALMLQELGARVHAVNSSAEALAAIQEEVPDVILSDIAMPGEDGYTFVRRVRQLPPERGGSTPAAALTALANDDDRQRAAEAGFQAHLSKPMDAARLAATVASLVARTKR